MLSTAGPGWYRLRAHARGRDTCRDGVADEPVEDYHLTIWPAPSAPASIIRATDQTGRGLRTSAAQAPSTPAPAPTYEEEAQQRTEDQLHANILKQLRKRHHD